jgi:bacterioferritin
MQTGRGPEGILSQEMTGKREEIIELLKTAYFMELETVMNYVPESINPDGVRAQQIKEDLAADIDEELDHARQFAARIKELYGVVPGSMDFHADQVLLQPPDHQTDVVHVIKGVIDAETKAIELYTRIIAVTEEDDPVTNDMTVAILHDEQGHRRRFEGYLKEYIAQGKASKEDLPPASRATSPEEGSAL